MNANGVRTAFTKDTLLFSVLTWSPRLLAVLRIVTALLFIEHATMKLFSFPAAMPGTNPLPALLMAAAAIELVTGLLVLVGLFVRPAAFVASGEMAVAYFMAHASQSFWPAVNMGDAVILFCFIFLYLSAIGPGTWSFETILRRAASMRND